jgi:hypothetical protein
MNRDKAERIRTLRTFQVFRAAHKLDAGKQGYAARQQHREATQVHVPLPAGLRRRGVPSEMQSPVRRALALFESAGTLRAIIQHRGSSSTNARYPFLLGRQSAARFSRERRSEGIINKAIRAPKKLLDSSRATREKPGREGESAHATKR